MTKTLAEQLARFGFKSKTADAIAAPEGFDDETTAPEVAETQVEEVTSTEVAEAEAPKAEVSEAETVKEAPKVCPYINKVHDLEHSEWERKRKDKIKPAAVMVCRLLHCVSQLRWY